MVTVALSTRKIQPEISGLVSMGAERGVSQYTTKPKKCGLVSWGIIAVSYYTTRPKGT